MLVQARLVLPKPVSLPFLPPGGGAANAEEAGAQVAGKGAASVSISSDPRSFFLLPLLGSSLGCQWHQVLWNPTALSASQTPTPPTSMTLLSGSSSPSCHILCPLYPTPA